MPITPRIQELFSNERKAKLMDAHLRNRSDGEVMHGPYDGESWKEMKRKEPAFFSEPRNLIFGIGADGVNPNNQMTSKYSVWPVNVIIYNLPPELATKNAFMMLPLIIPGRKQPKNIDVYLRPLLEEFKTLWDTGCLVNDASRPAEAPFRVRGMAIWTITDYPRYATISGKYIILTNL